MGDTPGYRTRLLARSGVLVLVSALAAAIFAASASAATPVPVVVDTDILSSVDDVGALAVAFALQQKNEAKVIAIGVNTRTSRPAVAPSSWKCAAAVAQFYYSATVPIGTDLPANGTEINTPDFLGPCANLAAPSTPSPDSAVNVYRRALAAQTDGSVVLVSTGYLENLSALLNSPADAISPLNGHDLIAKKVKVLVVMGGGFPSRAGENNLRGNPAAAQNVANNWPTKLVWSGYEVGDAVHTGQTLSTAQPASSPVRVAYEAFVHPGNWYYSYDLTAVYHAIRPADPLLTETGPGKSAVDNQGGNTFTSGAGNQYYLHLSDANALDTALETLLDLVPHAGTAAPANDNFASAQAIAGGSGTASGTNIAATTETNEPALTLGGWNSGASVWYSWTAPNSGNTTITTAGSSFDTMLAVYSGSTLGGLTRLASNDDVAATVDTSAVVLPVTGGTTYRIQVTGFLGPVSGQHSGGLTLNWSLPAPVSAPSNDNFASAQSIANSSGTAAGSNAGATLESGEPALSLGGWNSGASVWYSWSAPASGPVTIKTAGSNFDTMLAVYSGSTLTGLTRLASNDDAAWNDDSSLVTFTATGGTTYRIQVNGFLGPLSGLHSGTTSLSWSLSPSSPPTLASQVATLTNQISGDGLDSGTARELQGKVDDVSTEAAKSGGHPCDKAGELVKTIRNDAQGGSPKVSAGQASTLLSQAASLEAILVCFPQSVPPLTGLAETLDSYVIDAGFGDDLRKSLLDVGTEMAKSNGKPCDKVTSFTTKVQNELKAGHPRITSSQGSALLSGASQVSNGLSC